MNTDRSPTTAQGVTHEVRGRQQAWIAVDIDGVLASHVEQIIPILGQRFGFEIGHDDVRLWDFPIGKTSFGAIIRDEQRTPGFLLKTPPVPGAIDAMRRLAASYSVVIVTARPPETDPWTHQWLANHGIPYNAFENLGAGAKHETTMNCNVLIDDYTLNVLNFLQHTNGRAILFAQPWNSDLSGLESFLESRRLEVADSWIDVLSIVDRSILVPGRNCNA